MPPSPFTAEQLVLPAGKELYRVHSTNRQGTAFNDGHGNPTRFAFFGTPVVPIMHAAETERAAITETLLHDIPPTGGTLRVTDYERTALAGLVTRRELRLASFLGLGLRALGVNATDVTVTDAARYPETVRWADAAHRAGFDGVAYMSRLCNSDQAYAFFGDRVSASDFDVLPNRSRLFALPSDREWLTDFCAPYTVEVLVKGSK